MRVVPRRTVVGDIDRRFDNLSGSHHQSHVTSAQVVETSVNVTNNSPSRDYSHPDDQTTQTTETPGFKPFTVLYVSCLVVSTFKVMDAGLGLASSAHGGAVGRLPMRCGDLFYWPVLGQQYQLPGSWAPKPHL